ncbi:MAG: hypothetical protein M3P51_16725 [Chloroflexota bacterium]|nr:hypothetical protein [Chloroflexota bacterium]
MGEPVSHLLEQWEGMGFYRHASPQQISELKHEARATGYLFGGDAVARDYDADAEDLAEGGVQDFLERIGLFLAEQGVQITTVAQEFTDTGYTMTINGRVYTLYTEEELASEGMAELWELTTARTFALVNILLAEAGSKERVFGVYGGHDNRAVFLTDDMYAALRQSGVLPPQEMPIPMPGA